MKMSSGLVLCILLLAVSLIDAASFPKNFYIGDPYWMRAQAQAWLEGRDDIPAQYASQLEVGQYCFYNESSGKYYSKYGLFNSLFMLPVVAWWNFSGHTSLYSGNLSSTSFVSVLNYYNLLWTLGLAAALYWGASLLLGACSVIPQFFIPIAGQYSEQENKSRNMGIVLSGFRCFRCLSLHF